MKYTFAFIIVSMIFHSCEIEKEISYHTIYDGDRLIMQGFISRQDGVRVIVKKTLSPDNINGNNKVVSAVVTLYDGDRVVAVLNRHDDDQFISNLSFVPETGKKYSIRVSADNLNEVFSAPQSISPTTPVDSFKTVVYEDNPNYSHLIVYFTNNRPSSNTYYLKTTFYENGEEIESVAYEFFNPFGVINNAVRGFNSIERRIDTNKYDSLQIELYTLSPDLSLFLESQKKYDLSKDDPFFEQPYPVYSNITGGFGIFGTYSVYRKTIKQTDI
jgi:hypothetical protein